MSAPNFTKINARNYYVLNHTSTYIDDDGKEKQITKDYIDYSLDIENAKELGEKRNFHSYGKFKHEDYNNNLDAYPFLWKNKEFQYGKDNFLNSFNIEGRIYAIGGRYYGMNYDWDIVLGWNAGEEFLLSDYNDEESMIEDFMKVWEGTAFNYCDNWNAGLVKLHKDKIRNLIEKQIDICSDECDNLCRDACDEILVCTNIFSNGEAIYQKALNG